MNRMHEVPPGWNTHPEKYHQGIKAISRMMRPSKEMYDYYDSLRKAYCVNVIETQAKWFEANMNLPKFHPDNPNPFADILGKSEEVLSKWITTVLGGGEFMNPELAFPFSESFEYLKSYLWSNGGLEDRLRECISDNGWRNTPLAEMATASVLIGSYPTLIGIRNVCWYLRNCRDHIQWLFHNPGEVDPEFTEQKDNA